MKKKGILNSHISKVLSDLGHTDQIVIADAGLPIPNGVLKIDLALKSGIPSFCDVLSIVLDDMVVEKMILASEIVENNKVTLECIEKEFDSTKIEKITHEEFKVLTKNAKVIIRTGEVTPYANCILQSGVFF